jgi:uncharacterized protein
MTRDLLPLEEYSVTSQEEQMLNSLVERVNSTQLTEKDPDAAALLERGFSANSDAVYVLAQSVLVQNIALEQAHGQLQQAQQQIQQLQQQPPRATSFLGSLLGHHDPAPPPPQQVYVPQAAPEYQTPYNPPPPPYGGPAYGGPGYAGPPPYGGPQYGPPMSGGSSFLRGAAQTAAGVAAGALAFEGVEALLHGGFGHPGMGMGMGGWGMPGVGYGMGPGMGYERPMEETIVNNNYYDSPGGGQGDFGREEHFHEGGGQMQDASWGNDSGSGFDGGSGGGSDFGDSGGSDFGDSGGGGFDDGGSGGGDSGGF